MCGFAESDIIHRQQQGAARADVIAGIAQAMVRNYLGNVARGKKIREKIFFQEVFPPMRRFGGPLRMNWGAR